MSITDDEDFHSELWPGQYNFMAVRTMNDAQGDWVSQLEQHAPPRASDDVTLYISAHILFATLTNILHKRVTAAGASVTFAIPAEAAYCSIAIIHCSTTEQRDRIFQDMKEFLKEQDFGKGGVTFKDGLDSEAASKFWTAQLQFARENFGLESLRLYDFREHDNVIFEVQPSEVDHFLKTCEEELSLAPSPDNSELQRFGIYKGMPPELTEQPLRSYWPVWIEGTGHLLRQKILFGTLQDLESKRRAGHLQYLVERLHIGKQAQDASSVCIALSMAQGSAQELIEEYNAGSETPVYHIMERAPVATPVGMPELR